jgi:hypothetical protein
MSLVAGRAIPIAAQTETRAVTPAAETPSIAILFAADYPSASLPSGPALDFLLWHATIDPGVAVDVPTEYGACCPGPLFCYVLSGELVLRVEGPLQIIRAGTSGAPGTIEDVRPGAEAVLRPGDTAVWRFELPATYANRGASPLRLVSGGIFGGYAPAPLDGYLVPDFVELFPAPRLPPGPITMELIRATLPPHAAIAAAPAGSPRLALRASGGGVLGQQRDGAIENLGRTAMVVDILTLFPRTGAGTLAS